MLLGVIVFSWSVMGSGCTVAFFVPPKRSRVRPPIYTTVWDVTVPGRALASSGRLTGAPGPA
jgi:hypothetical protein